MTSIHAPAVRRFLVRPAVVAAAFGTLALAGCGGDEEPQGPIVSPSAMDLTPTVRVELTRGIYKDNDPGDPYAPVITEKESACIADALLEKFDVDGLIAISVVDNKGVYSGQPMGVPADQAELWLDGFASCIDLTQYAVNVARAGVRTLAPDFAKDDAKWVEVRGCVDQADPEAARGLLLEQLTATVKQTPARQAFVDCVKIAYPDATA